jgi:hypothetical protein
MITAIRLRPYNPQRGFKRRTYVSAALVKTYRAGQNGLPSTWHILDDQRELDELDELADRDPQFQIKEFEDIEDIEEMVQDEMEDAIREGGQPVRAIIDGLPAEYQENLERRIKKATRGVRKPKRAAAKKKRVDLSVLEESSAKANPPKEEPEPSNEPINVDDVEIDFDKEVAVLQEKIDSGEYAASTVRKYEARIRALNLDREDWEREQKKAKE